MRHYTHVQSIALVAAVFAAYSLALCGHTKLVNTVANRLESKVYNIIADQEVCEDQKVGALCIWQIRVNS